MPQTFGNDSGKTIFLKSEEEKLHEEFECEGQRTVLTFSAALITGNKINGSINGFAITEIPFTSNNDNTLQLLAQEIMRMPGVSSAYVTLVAGATTNDRVVTIVPEIPSTLGRAEFRPLGPVSATSFAVTGGASQATITVTDADKNVYQGMPVQINSNGRVEPLTAANAQLDGIGYAVIDGYAGQMTTVMVKGFAITYGKASGAMVPGACNYDSYDAINKNLKYNQTSVTQAKLIGHCLDTAADTETVRVILQ